VLFDFNVQHDCHGTKCEANSTRTIIQERAASRKIEAIMVHKLLDRYILNLCSFHNAHLIRGVLPRDLCAPIPLYLNRETHHKALA
ncbi:hypothetical protein C8F01DRAFT_947188, partial [Mycena amicta]